MTPEQRKSASEARIRLLDIPNNENCRLDEVQRRSPEDMLAADDDVAIGGWNPDRLQR